MVELQNPQTFFDHIKNEQADLQAEKEAKLNPFPVKVFPEQIQHIINETNRCLNFPIDFISASTLFAASVSIGNTYKVKFKNDWIESAVLYIAIVGQSGTNKSHPLSWALKPLETINKQNFEKYKKEKAEYEISLNRKKADREENEELDLKLPFWEQWLISDFTPEALTEAINLNKRGIGVYVDELASWFKNFNRYNKGSQEQFWLSVWSGKTVIINRKTSEPICITNPFIPVIGTIQPGVITQLAANRTENGFMDRILFAFPDDLQKKCWSDSDINPTIKSNWETMVLKLITLDMKQKENFEIEPTLLEFSNEAKQHLYEWNKEQTNEYNRLENDGIKGIYAKMDSYAIRFSLLLEMLKYACEESNKNAISLSSVKGAIQLVDYFKKSAIKVHSTISNVSPLKKLPIDKQDLYKSLPNKFTTKEGLRIAESLSIPERTFKDFINKKDLFSRIIRGNYEKRF